MTTPYVKKRQANWKKERKVYLLGSLFCFASAIFLFSTRNNTVNPNRIISLGTLTLKEKPSIDKEPGKNGHHYLKLIFTEIQRPLKLSGVDYNCANKQQLLENFKQGDTLLVLVDKNDFSNYSKFEGEKVYGLIANKKNYCDLECRNKTFNSSQKIGAVTFTSLALLCLIAGVLPSKPRLIISKYKSYDIEPLFIILLVTVAIIFIAKPFI